MHVPDGIFPIEQALIYLIIAIGMLVYSLSKIEKEMDERAIPLIGVLGAGLFAAQMFNFPTPYGASGHLVGTALATIIVGPWAAILVISGVLFIQMLFGDGGVLAYGVNLLNMGIIGAFVSIAIIQILYNTKGRKLSIAAIGAITGFFATVTMAVALTIELIFAGVGPADTLAIWMIGLHLILGLGEAAITYVVLEYISRSNPSIFRNYLERSE
ncbi:MAG: energy-coupling factor ABC transporter permease [Candidatus Kariarchaeaceae archaeon]